MLPNTTPSNIAKIELRETGTIYAVKLSVSAFSSAANAGDIQELNMAIRCVAQGQDQFIPDFASITEIETINGFFVGNLWGQRGSDLGNFISTIGSMTEKFRFRRKCDENSFVQLFGDTVVRAGVARSMQVVGVMELIIRIR